MPRFALFLAAAGPSLGALALQRGSANGTEGSQECPPDAYPDGKNNCVDHEGNHVPLECCGSSICKQQLDRFAGDGALRLQTYMMGCGLLPSDTQVIDGVVAVADSSRLCADSCQGFEALGQTSPLSDLAGLEDLCAKELSTFQALIHSLAAFDEAWSACAGGKDLELALTEELARSSLPVTQDADWSISGSIVGILDQLRSNSDFPISCSAKSSGKPLWMVMQSSTPTARVQMEMAWESTEGFASIRGMGKFASKAAYMFENGGQGLKLAHQLAAVPSKRSLDRVVDFLLDSPYGPQPAHVRKFWQYLLKTENTVKLTSKDPTQGTKVAKFTCTKGNVEGSPAQAFAMFADGEGSTPVTARHLAFLIASLA